MITVPELAADALGEFLANYMRRRFGSSQAHLVEMVPSIARIALECIGNSDALYHKCRTHHAGDAGGARHSARPRASYPHARGRLCACDHRLPDPRHRLCARAVQVRRPGRLSRRFDSNGRKVTLPRGSSDAALLPYHVDRSKMFVTERIEGIAQLDKRRIARAVEGTRFPSSFPSEDEQCDEEAALLRAADLIGQLGDPHYIRKANALYYEFEEAGLNRQLGYSSPADLVNLYPQFYWNSVAPHVQTAIRYLNVTSSGRQWIANLYSNVFRAERDISLSGPQK